jgi:ATP-binding cassette subfamily B protein
MKQQRFMLLRYMLRYRWQYLLGLACLVIVDFIELYIPQLTGEITDGLESGTMALGTVGGKAALIVGIAAVVTLMRLGWRVLLFGSARKVERDLRGDLFQHLSTLSNRFYQDHKTGDLMAHFTNDLDAVRMAVGPAILTTFDAIFMTLLVLGKMIVYVDLKLTLMAMVPLLVILFGGSSYGKAVKRRYEKKQAAFSRLTDRVQESITGVRVIKAFVQEKQEMDAFDAVNRDARSANLRVVRLRAVVLPLLDGLIGIASAITLLYGGYLVLQGDVTIGRFVAFNSYVTTLVWPMTAAGESITMISQGAASWKRVRSLLAEKPEICDDALTDHTIIKLDGSIACRDLHFRYDEALPEVLTGFDADIPAGSMVGILGKTGSGKTTIANLLVRLYNTEPGQLFVGGHDIRTIPIAVLRQHIAYVPQDNFLFSDTLQSNIAFGVRTADQLPKDDPGRLKIFLRKAEAAEAWAEQELNERESRVDAACDDLDQVVDAAKAACVHDNILDFPKQYATVVGERGVTVSGGQKQRSSIARALMKDAELLILDDALSAVDTDTEKRILENLRRLRQGKTTILIAHRISTVQQADQILVMDGGKCAEAGDHQTLLALNGRYTRLFEQQQLEQQLQAEKEAFHAETE